MSEHTDHAAPDPPGTPLGAAGACPAVVWRGGTYKLGHPTQAAKDRYCEALLDAEARRFRVLLDRELITRAEYDARLDRLGGQVDVGAHRPGGAIWLRYAVGEDATAGTVLFAWALFAENHPTLPVDHVRQMLDEEPAQVKLARRRVLSLFFAWAGDALRLPPEKRAEFDKNVRERIDRMLPLDPSPDLPTSGGGTT